MKRCPYCAEKIQDKAVICRFCGRDLPIQTSSNGKGLKNNIKSHQKNIFIKIWLIMLTILTPIISLLSLFVIMAIKSEEDLSGSGPSTTLFFVLFLLSYGTSTIAGWIFYSKFQNKKAIIFSFIFIIPILFLLVKNSPLVTNFEAQMKITKSHGKVAYFAVENENRRLFVINSDGYNPKLYNQRLYNDLDYTFQRDLDFSPNLGKIVYTCDSQVDITPHICITNIDSSGFEILEDYYAWSPQFSPDGKSILYLIDNPMDFVGDKEMGIYTMNIDGSEKQLLAKSSDSLRFSNASWSFDGKSIIFCGTRKNNDVEIFIMNSDGLKSKIIAKYPNYIQNLRLSPDEQKIIFIDYYNDIYSMNIDGSGINQLTKDHNVFDIGWSPDGSQIVYEVNKDDGFYIYVMNVDGSNMVEIAKGLLLNWLP